MTRKAKPKRSKVLAWGLFDDDGEMIYTPFRNREMARDTARRAGLRVARVRVTTVPL